MVENILWKQNWGLSGEEEHEQEENGELKMSHWNTCVCVLKKIQIFTFKNYTVHKDMSTDTVIMPALFK